MVFGPCFLSASTLVAHITYNTLVPFPRCNSLALPFPTTNSSALLSQGQFWSKEHAVSAWCTLPVSAPKPEEPPDGPQPPTGSSSEHTPEAPAFLGAQQLSHTQQHSRSVMRQKCPPSCPVPPFYTSAPCSVLHTILCAPPAVPANLSPPCAQDTQDGWSCPRWNLWFDFTPKLHSIRYFFASHGHWMITLIKTEKWKTVWSFLI